MLLVDGDEPMILVLGYTPPAGLAKAAAARISLTLTDDDDLWPRYLAEAERQPLERAIPFHLNIDTGMTRVGIPVSAPERIDVAALRLQETRWAELEGVYTHFPRAENARREAPEDEAFTLGQVRAFETTFDRLRRAGHRPTFVHLASSPAVEQYREALDPEWVSHARPGSLLHGMSIDPGAFERASTWTTT